jgi:hypothetical protein
MGWVGAAHRACNNAKLTGLNAERAVRHSSQSCQLIPTRFQRCTGVSGKTTQSPENDLVLLDPMAESMLKASKVLEPAVELLVA